jgi:bacillithiol biosynthesis deacetylase BshB1
MLNQGLSRSIKVQDKMARVLIIAPHPDDAEFAMGGTIVKMVESGWDVIVVDLTDGEPTPFGSKEQRAKEAQEASCILGINKRTCLEMPNRYLRATFENRRKLSEIIRLNQPDLIFGPVLPDYHPDHVEAAKLIEGARFEAKFHKTDMKGTPYWASRQYGYYSTHRLYHQMPSLIVNVTKQWDSKIKAIRAYKSQISVPSSANSISLPEAIEVTCRYFGQCIGARYGEPFFSCEPIGGEKSEMLLELLSI